MEQLGRNKAGLILAAIVVLGLGAGVAIGLVLGWVVAPVRYVDTSIADLAPADKDEYIALVASGYALDGNMDRAQTRLSELDVPNVNESLSFMIDRWIAEGRDAAEIRPLAALAHDLGVSSRNVLAYVASPTPPPSDTPLPTATATDTPVPTTTPIPTDTPTELPTDTPVPAPTDTPVPAPTDTPAPQPTNTPAAPTNTPKPKPTKTPAPPTNTPKPAQPKWAVVTELIGPRHQTGQQCDAGAQYIRVTVVDANNIQLGGQWVHEMYTGATIPTGHKAGDPAWGGGEVEVLCAGRSGAGGTVCVSDANGNCISPWSRGMSCFDPPSFEDMYAAGYCDCCWQGISKEDCQVQYNQGAPCMNWNHFSWHVTFKRNW